MFTVTVGLDCVGEQQDSQPVGEVVLGDARDGRYFSRCGGLVGGARYRPASGQ